MNPDLGITSATTAPAGCIDIKHDGLRVIARKNGMRVFHATANQALVSKRNPALVSKRMTAASNNEPPGQRTTYPSAPQECRAAPVHKRSSLAITNRPSGACRRRWRRRAVAGYRRALPDSTSVNSATSLLQWPAATHSQPPVAPEWWSLRRPGKKSPGEPGMRTSQGCELSADSAVRLDRHLAGHLGVQVPAAAGRASARRPAAGRVRRSRDCAGRIRDCQCAAGGNWQFTTPNASLRERSR
jgi:hypothetical protein